MSFLFIFASHRGGNPWISEYFCVCVWSAATGRPGGMEFCQNFSLQDCHLKACLLRSSSGARPPEEQVAGPREFPWRGERQKSVWVFRTTDWEAEIPGETLLERKLLEDLPKLTSALCTCVCGVGCGVYVHVCDVCGVEWIVCLCGVCRVRGWDVGINSSVNSQNSQMGVICFKLFWKGCLQKNKTTTTKPQKTKQKWVVEFNRRPCYFTYQNSISYSIFPP